MNVNQLFVLPAQETLDFFSAQFSGCPFDLDLSKMYLEVNSSLFDMEPLPEEVYIADMGAMDIYFDQSTMSSSLLLPVYSKSLTDRCAELRENAPTTFYGEDYFPFLVVKQNVNTLSRSTRRFIRSLSDTMVNLTDHRLLFEGEFVLQNDYATVPWLDYYNQQRANIAIR